MPAIGQRDTGRLLGQLNLNHLLYFWAVGQAGSITAAAERLGVAQPSVSAQVRLLEARLGTRLLERGARGVALTAAGQIAMRYAEEVVGVCSDLVRLLPLAGGADDRPLSVGAADTVPKLIVRSILRPLVQQEPIVSIVCREWRVDQLLAELSVHRLDLVISDTAPERTTSLPLRSFTAGISGVSVYAAPALARRLRRGFPRSLDGAPLLLPAHGTALRAALDRWFQMHRLRPHIVLEADDRALLHHFAEAGDGAVCIASITAVDVARQFGLVRIGDLRQLHEEYFVLVHERANKHPALARLLQALSQQTFVIPGLERRTRRPDRRRRAAPVKPNGARQK